MFFIGIFGIQDKTEKIYTQSSSVCPVCGAYGRYEIIKIYRFFHIFFIPVVRWKYRYYIQTHCCQNYCEIDPDTGMDIEKGYVRELQKEQIHCNDSNTIRICPNCSAKIDPNFNYCPSCGHRM